ncbi:MAG: hypothetical protein MJB14_19495 [Spirochaetes bacterium]|nr:hypothetical protein [Spirochaetota bacterium]
MPRIIYANHFFRFINRFGGKMTTKNIIILSIIAVLSLIGLSILFKMIIKKQKK